MPPVTLVAFCPHCGNRAPQRLLLTHQFRTYLIHDDGRHSKPEVPAAYYGATCTTCGDLLIYLSEGIDDDDGRFTSYQLIWPNPGVLHKSVPKRVSECYAEAARIKNLAPNAFAVQIRRALEALCDDRGVQSGILHRRLQALAANGEIPPLLAEMTDVLRILGNFGAHAAEQSIQLGHVDVIDEFFRAIVEYVYVAPSKLKAFRGQLDRLKGGPPTP